MRTIADHQLELTFGDDRRAVAPAPAAIFTTGLTARQEVLVA